MNKKNKLTGQILRIAALALSISLIFGSMAVFYAAEGDEGTGTTVSDSDTAPGAGGTASDSDASSGAGGTASGSDVTPGAGGTTSGSDVTTSGSDVTTSGSDVEEEFVKPYRLSDYGMWDTISIDDIDAMTDGESILIDIGGSVVIEDANGRLVCALAKAVADGATVSYPDGYPKTHEIDRPGRYDCDVIVPGDEPTKFYIYEFCLEDADLESNNKLTVRLPMTVTLADGTVISETDTGSELTFELWVTDGSSGGNNTTAGNTGGSEATTAGSSGSGSEATTKKTTSPTKKPSSNTTNNTPDTSDITAANDNPGRSTAAAIMLSLGLLIAGAVAAERIYQANQEKIRRANAVRR